MEPIYIILYVVIVTLMLTLAMPRLRTMNPRLAWFLLIIGVIGLLAIAAVILMR